MRVKSKSGGWSFDGDRREHSRVPLRSPVLVDSQSIYQSGPCEDVSAGGICVSLEQPLSVGTYVELYFELPTGVAVESVAKVVRATGHKIAFRYIGLNAEARKALLAYCELSGVRRIVLAPAV